VAALVVSVQAAPAARADDRAAEAEICFQAAEAAQPLMRQNKLRAAQAALAVCTRDACPRTVRSDCEGWMATVARAQPRIALAAFEQRGAETARIRDVRVQIDGEPIVPLDPDADAPIDPGPHTVRFERAGFDPIEQRIDVAADGATHRVDATFHAREAPRPPRTGVPPLAIALGGAGVLALGGGIYFEATGLSDRARLSESCRPSRACSAADVDAARRRVLAGDLLVTASVVLLGSAAYVYFTRDRRAAGVRLGVRPTASGIAAGIEGSL
jgi:hypothetical protein